MNDARSWYVLLHRPGPAVVPGQSVADHPGIGAHYAFLERRMQDGTLVAAGPMTDEPGHGMTVLAVSSLEEAHRLAEGDDESVASGVLAVSVRPWRVVLAPIAESAGDH